MNNAIQAPRTKKYLFLISALILFHALSNYFWIRFDHEGLGEDVAPQIAVVVDMHGKLSEILSSGRSIPGKIFLTQRLASSYFSFASPFLYNPHWPLFVHFVTAFISIPFDGETLFFFIRFSNIFYMAVIIVSIYLLGKALHSREAGMAAAYLVSLYPAVFNLSRKFGTDLPLVSIVCAGVYFLLKTDRFRSKGYSAIFGICFGIGLLIKATCLFFIIGPLLYILVTGSKEGAWRSRTIKNVVFSMLIAFFISWTWWSRLVLAPYRPDPRYIGMFLFEGMNTVLKYSDLPFWDQVFYYAKAMVLNISPVFFIIFLTGLFFYIRKMNRKNWPIPLYWLFVSHILLSLIFARRERYLFPVFGAVVLISSIGLMESPFKKTARYILALAVIFGFLQYFVLSYFITPPPNYISPEYYYMPEINNHYAVIKSFDSIIRGYGPVDKTIGIMEEFYMSGDRCIRLSNFLRVACGDNYSVFLSNGGSDPPQMSDKFLSDVDRFDFLIAFARRSKDPDFSGLVKSMNKSGNATAEGKIARLKQFKILKRETLMPERVGIFLLQNNASAEQDKGE
ncbi:MAG: glycosyltransferase family 39 protein [Candidatus Omnitrophota bacterium]